ncbi:MAG: ribose 5-phosphate isomerase B [Clostridia bacterium]|nr:ribose 5-phosphate isomerase B [Clostridia bacterium]
MLIIGADHGGFELKEEIKKYFDKNSIKYYDIGALMKDDNDNFPEIALPLAKKVASNEYEKGILICGSGVGVCMAANRIKGARAVNCNSEEIAKLSRLHNNANILCLGGRFITKDEAISIINVWLNTEFLGGKYDIRNKMLDE